MNRARIVLVIVMCSSYLHSMEIESVNLTYTYGATKINLTKGNIYDFDGKANLIVLGEREKEIETSFYAQSKSTILSGIEPKVFLIHDKQKNESTYCYHTFSHASPSERVRLHTFHKGEEAIKHAGNDLHGLYQDALAWGVLQGKALEKTIAIPTLGTATGFPRDRAAVFAVSAIIDYIKRCSKDYNVIYLVMNEESDFDLYKKLLGAHIAEQK